MSKESEFAFLPSPQTSNFVMSSSDRASIKQTIQGYAISNPGEALGMKQLRSQLVERGLVFSDSRWNEEIKPVVRDVIAEIVSHCIYRARQNGR